MLAIHHQFSRKKRVGFVATGRLEVLAGTSLMALNYILRAAVILLLLLLAGDRPISSLSVGNDKPLVRAEPQSPSVSPHSLPNGASRGVPPPRRIEPSSSSTKTRASKSGRKPRIAKLSRRRHAQMCHCKLG